MVPSIRCTLLAFILALVAPWLEAVEKHWIAHNADIVVVGHFLDPEMSNPLLSHLPLLRKDGWSLTGKLIVDESLFGPILNGAKLPFEWECRDCPAPQPSMVNDMFKRKGLWFLLKTKTGWTSAGPEHGDPGYRDMKDRDDFVQYLRERPKSQIRNSK